MIPRRRPDAPLRRLDSRVSRRGLLGAGVLAGVLAASGVSLQARTRGGILRIGLASRPPRGEGWLRAQPVISAGAVYDTLAEIGPTGELLGDLAQSWEATPAADVWHVSLRPDVRFHDGSLLTSADVVASLLRHRRSRAAWALSRVTRIDPAGPHAIRIALAEGDPDFPLVLAEPALVIAREGRFDGVGTGLYRLAPDQGEPGELLRLERVEAHRKDGQAGWFDAIEAVHLPEPRDRLEALVSARIDVTGPLGPVLVAEAEAAGLEITSVQGNRQLHIAPPRGAARGLSDILPQAVDRQTLAVQRGGRPAADHPLGLLHPALAPIEPPPFDPVLAEALAGKALRLSSWDGAPTEDATFRKALAGPWAPVRGHPFLRRELEAARRAQGEERLAHYAAAQAIFAQTALVVVAAHIPALTLHARSLAHGPAVSGHSAFDGGRLPERWWFA